MPNKVFLLTTKGANKKAGKNGAHPAPATSTATICNQSAGMWFFGNNKDSIHSYEPISQILDSFKRYLGLMP